MNKRNIQNKIITFDDNGFMTDFCQWDRNIAEQLAGEQGIALTKQHWAIIDFIQISIAANKYISIRRLNYHNIVTPRELYTLFPERPIETAMKIAGVSCTSTACS